MKCPSCPACGESETVLVSMIYGGDVGPCDSEAALQKLRQGVEGHSVIAKRTGRQEHLVDRKLQGSNISRVTLCIVGEHAWTGSGRQIEPQPWSYCSCGLYTWDEWLTELARTAGEP